MTPQSCPSCGTELPEGARRCPGCARVFGEQNRCPSCHALAPAMERKGQLICAACGAPRIEDPGVEVLAPSKLQGTSIALRVVGYGLFAAAFVFAGVSALVDQYLLATLLGVGFALPGWFSLRRASAAAEQTKKDVQRGQLRLVGELMADHAGRITAAQAARKLGVDVQVADALLTSAAKDGTFEVDFDDEGSVYYIDPAFDSRGARARVRVDASEPQVDGEEVDEKRESADQRRNS